MALTRHRTNELEPAAAPPLPATPAEAIAHVEEARQSIWMTVFLKMGKAVSRFGLLTVEKPSEQNIKQVAVDYPIWAIAERIKQASALGPGPRLDGALEAARASAQKYAADHLSDLIASQSVDFLTSPPKVQELVEALTDAEIDGFRKALA
ncbi:MAG: hypothetical protein ACXVQY_12055 [Actinomycetota bacterium]